MHPEYPCIYSGVFSSGLMLQGRKGRGGGGGELSVTFSEHHAGIHTTLASNLL